MLSQEGQDIRGVRRDRVNGFKDPEIKSEKVAEEGSWGRATRSQKLKFSEEGSRQENSSNERITRLRQFRGP